MCVRGEIRLIGENYQVESVEDGDTLLVAGGQYWTSNRYMDTILGRSIMADLTD